MLLEDKDKLLQVAQEDKELKLMVRKIFEQSEDPNVIGVYDKDEMNAWKMDVAKSIALEKGLERGLEQGQKEKSIDIAKNMLVKKMDIETISEITGLTINEIEGLK